MENGKYTKEEIFSQPEAWEDALKVTAAHKRQLQAVFAAEYDQVLFTGCGSTYYLSLAASALFQEMTGKLARAVPGGELLLNEGVTLTNGKTLLVAVSRSGSTTETVRAVEQFKKEGKGAVVAITNAADQPLASLADVALVMEKGQEKSVAQTRSFASMYVAATAMTMTAANAEILQAAMQQLPGAGEKLLAACAAPAQALGENLTYDRFYFLGSGARYGLACEVNLKMKEMTLTHSEPFHFLEFRHGPMAMVNENTVMVGLVSEQNAAHEQAVLNEMQAKGAEIFALAEANARLNFQSGIPAQARNVLYLPALQLMSFYRSLAKGLNPDQPKNLSAVVRLV